MSLIDTLSLLNRNDRTQGGASLARKWSHVTVLLGVNLIPSVTGPTGWWVKFSSLARVPVTCTSSTQKYGVCWAFLYSAYTTSCQQTDQHSIGIYLHMTRGDFINSSISTLRIWLYWQAHNINECCMYEARVCINIFHAIQDIICITTFTRARLRTASQASSIQFP